MENNDKNTTTISVTNFDVLLLLAFILVPWCIGMLDICNRFWNFVLR